jgi:phosphoribosylformylglycinamidine synthase
VRIFTTNEDINDIEGVAFKMESHNHPSFIEPTQGAATGVGGILRDIFTMGARPIASMDYLCFGEPKDKESPRLLSGVVKGVGGYGNCVGVPTVNGQTTFHPTYNKNNLVNAFSLGLFRPGEEVFYGKASGVGNLIVYAGARTGRDGVHGAAMASESFGSNLEAKKPNVQIGDPFYEKLLIEACLEVMKQNLVVGIQDMGAAGLTSSTFEMAARAGTGLKIDLSKIPLREPDITPEEILLSESQERMVMVIEPKNLNKVADIFRMWDLDCAVIGEITDDKKVELIWKGQSIA